MAGLRLPEGLSLGRVQTRNALKERLDGAGERAYPATKVDSSFGSHYSTAIAILGDPRKARAFELDREPETTRERYGPTRFARSLLLARRLIEGGISLVTVNYDDETRNEKVSPFWDTHHQNFPSLKERLAPRFDRAYSALLEDLERSGLLETTLVVVTGEFGRTPRVGQFVQNAMTEKTGRDHWPHAFTVLLAGGGIRGGRTFGATDAHGAYVRDSPVTPADLTATILHHLGIDSTREYWDEFQQVRRRLCEGMPLRNLG
jgi:hypothetical protein